MFVDATPAVQIVCEDESPEFGTGEYPVGHDGVNGVFVGPLATHVTLHVPLETVVTEEVGAP